VGAPAFFGATIRRAAYERERRSFVIDISNALLSVFRNRRFFGPVEFPAARGWLGNIGVPSMIFIFLFSLVDIYGMATAMSDAVTALLRPCAVHCVKVLER
jgi:hypothetical protein